jgi:hypothetical protein
MATPRTAGGKNRKARVRNQALSDLRVPQRASSIDLSEERTMTLPIEFVILVFLIVFVAYGIGGGYDRYQ